jgi:hypothetical protein
MKWILILRNPVDRAFSAWRMQKDREQEHLSFREAVGQESARCREALPLQHRVYSYVDRGIYAHQVRRVFQMFGREICLVLLNEDLAHNHETALRSVFSFLGVDPAILPPPTQVFRGNAGRKLDPQVRAKLCDLFYFDIRELERLISRDLSAWYSLPDCLSESI